MAMPVVFRSSLLFFFSDCIRFETMSDNKNEMSDGKLATGSAAAGVNSITNTVGMHPSTTESSPPMDPATARAGSCDHPGCTTEHSGKPHQ